MPDIQEELVRRIAQLEEKVRLVQVQKNLFEILNVATVDLTADETAWDMPDADLILFENSAATVNIHGIRNGVNGRVVYLVNTQPGTTVNFIQNSGSAALGDRFYGVGSLTNVAVTIMFYLIVDSWDPVYGYWTLP